jgi:hypothetical protein
MIPHCQGAGVHGRDCGEAVTVAQPVAAVPDLAFLGAAGGSPDDARRPVRGPRSSSSWASPRLRPQDALARASIERRGRGSEAEAVSAGGVVRATQAP